MYMDELRINWTGSPLFKAKHYVVKTNSTAAKLLLLQNKPGVIDFPNVDTDELSKLTQDRKTKDTEIKKVLGLKDLAGEKVKDYINRAAMSEGNSWDKDKLFVPDE
jgi:hypothetical protein